MRAVALLLFLAPIRLCGPDRGDQWPDDIWRDTARWRDTAVDQGDPTVSMDRPLNNEVWTAGSRVTLRGRTDIAFTGALEFTLDDALVCTANGSAAAIECTLNAPTTPGEVEVTLTAWNAVGLASQSSARVHIVDTDGDTDLDTDVDSDSDSEADTDGDTALVGLHTDLSHPQAGSVWTEDQAIPFVLQLTDDGAPLVDLRVVWTLNDLQHAPLTARTNAEGIVTSATFLPAGAYEAAAVFAYEGQTYEVGTRFEVISGD